MSQRLISALKRRAVAWAGQTTSLAKAYAPSHLKPYIHSKVEEPELGRFIIRTMVDRNANPQPSYGSLDARAQEYGSGLRARRGAKKKYIIQPKTAPFLEFLGTNEFDGWLIRTSQVKHPGIRAANNGKGYIAPAANEIRKRGRAELSRDVRESILGDARASFGGRVK